MQQHPPEPRGEPRVRTYPFHSLAVEYAVKVEHRDLGDWRHGSCTRERQPRHTLQWRSRWHLRRTTSLLVSHIQRALDDLDLVLRQHLAVGLRRVIATRDAVHSHEFFQLYTQTRARSGSSQTLPDSRYRLSTLGTCTPIASRMVSTKDAVENLAQWPGDHKEHGNQDPNEPERISRRDW